MPSTDYLHPEFGYFGPGPRLRRDLKVACFSLLFGVMAGAVVIAALGGRDDGDADAAALAPAVSAVQSHATAADAGASAPASAISPPARAGVPAITAPRMRFVRTGNSAHPGAGKPGAGKPGTASAVIATDGKAEKAEPVAAAPARLADGSPSPTAVPVQPPPAEHASPAPRAAAAAKRKAARAQARRRNDTEMEYSWRDERPDRWYARGYAGYGYPRGGYGREGPYARGFWGW
jgi:hypothetical protein